MASLWHSVPMSTPHSVIITSVELEPATLERAIQLNTGVAVLPAAQMDGKPVYSEAAVMLVKELRTLGTTAEYLDASDSRVFEVKKGAIETAVLSLVLGIASSAAWDGVKTWLARRRGARLAITYVELENSDGRRGKAWRVEGDADQAIQAIDRLRTTGGSSEDQTHSPEQGD
jgi:hypothetical protein